jgi:hypothetical protein
MGATSVLWAPSDGRPSLEDLRSSAATSCTIIPEVAER